METAYIRKKAEKNAFESRRVDDESWQEKAGGTGNTEP